MNALKINAEVKKYRNNKLYFYFRMQIKAKTWSRDSHGLFDYENNQVKSTTLNIESNGSITRKDSDVNFVMGNEMANILSLECIELAKIILENGKNN